MEMANLLDFNLHGKWVERLMSARLDPVPATHVVPSFGQLQLADAGRGSRPPRSAVHWT